MKHICQDCHKPTELIQQPKWNGGFIELATCRTEGCTLAGVTLSPDQFERLTETQLQEYRTMVINRMEMESKS